MAIEINLMPYYMGGFYGLLFLFFLLFSTARSEIMDALMLSWARFRYKKNFSRLKFIGADMISKHIYAQSKEAMHELDDKRFIINPAKAILEKGIRTFYFVNNNAAGHDFKHSPKEMLDKILDSSEKVYNVKMTRIEKIKGKIFNKKHIVEETEKVTDITEQVHNIWDEPYKFDATTIQNTINQAQLSAPSIVDKLLKMFTSKNFLTLAIVTVCAAGAAAFLGFLTYNELAQAEFCRQAATTLTPN